MTRLPVWLILVAIFMVLMTGSAQGQEDETREIHVTAMSVGELYWFKVEGVDGRNPAIHLEPGDRVELTLDNNANTAHNIRFGPPLDQEMPLLEPGEQDTLTFLVPLSVEGESSYWCQPHRSLGMSGRVVFDPETEQAGGLGEATAVGLLMIMFVGLHKYRRLATEHR